MKYCIILTLLFAFDLSFSQSKHSIYFKADLLMESISASEMPGAKVYAEKVYGTDVIVAIDTVFNKYTFLYTTEMGSIQTAQFFFVKDRWENQGKLAPQYIMRSRGDDDFKTPIYLADARRVWRLIVYLFYVDGGYIKEYIIRDLQYSNPEEIKKMGLWDTLKKYNPN